MSVSPCPGAEALFLEVPLLMSLPKAEWLAPRILAGSTHPVGSALPRPGSRCVLLAVLKPPGAVPGALPQWFSRGDGR